MSGQSIQDRMIAAKHSISGQGLAKSVCKATTEEVMGPKKKHLDYLVQCTHEPNVSIPQLANLLIERAQNANWVTVFKSLVTLHNLMNYGNERFTQYLASNNCTLSLSNFIDKAGVQGYDMSTYIRRYAKYLNEKAYAYRTMAFDFCKVKRGKQDGLLRTMAAEKLLKTLPTLQRQLDALVEFDVTSNELTNGVVNAAFMLLFKDLIRLFACYNDGIINLLETYFDMQKKQCREALEIYKRFLARMERCAEFLKVAESVGIDKGDIPDLAKAPSSLLEALEEHLKALEGQKKTKSTDKASRPVVAAAITQLQSPTSPTASGVSEEEKRKIIEEETKQLQQYEKTTSPTAEGKHIPHASPVVAAAKPVNSVPPPVVAAPTAKPSTDLNDLLGLGFGDAGATSGGFDAAPAGPGAATTNPFGGAAPALAAPAPMYSAPPIGFDSFGAILQPHNPNAPQNHVQAPATTANQKLMQNDIDSSLASLAGNLTVGGAQLKTNQQWGPVQERKLTGGNNWQNLNVASSTMPGMNAATGAMYSAPVPQHQYYPIAPSHGYMNGQPLGYGNIPSQPLGMQQPPQPMGIQQPVVQPMGMQPMYPAGMAPQGVYAQPRPPVPQQNPQDPFGAL